MRVLLLKPSSRKKGTLIIKGLFRNLLEGSWVVISAVRSPLIWVVSIVTLLITALTTTHEPPSVYEVQQGAEDRRLPPRVGSREKHKEGLHRMCGKGPVPGCTVDGQNPA